MILVGGCVCVSNDGGNWCDRQTLAAGAADLLLTRDVLAGFGDAEDE